MGRNLSCFLLGRLGFGGGLRSWFTITLVATFAAFAPPTVPVFILSLPLIPAVLLLLAFRPPLCRGLLRPCHSLVELGNLLGGSNICN